MDIQYGFSFPIAEVKASGDSWEVEGHPSTFGNVDYGGDVVMRGAFDRTLASGNPVRFLLGHDQTKVLGVPLALQSDEKGLYGRFKISRTSLGQDVHTLLKDGAIDAFSIGYVPQDIEFDDQGVRLLKDVDLLEVSLVAVPMNPQAMVTGVKQKDAPPSTETQLKFAEHLDIVMSEIAGLLKRTEEIAALRAGDGKRLSGAKFEQLKTLRAGVDDLLRLENPHNDAPPADALRLRLAIARRKHARLFAESTN